MSLKYKKHDGGRKDAGYKGSAGDCGARAIAIATNQPYRKTYNELSALYREMTFELERTPRNGLALPILCEYLSRLGWVAKATSGQYLEEIPKKGTYIAYITRHYAAVIDGVVYDSWDSRKSNRTKGGSPVMLGYFFKESDESEA